MPESQHVRFVQVEAERLPFYLLGEHLWGRDANLDSDGNSHIRDSRHWTELSLTNRARPSERIDIDPTCDRPLVLKVVGATADLADRAAQWLVSTSEGHLVEWEAS